MKIDTFSFGEESLDILSRHSNTQFKDLQVESLEKYIAIKSMIQELESSYNNKYYTLLNQTLKNPIINGVMISADNFYSVTLVDYQKLKGPSITVKIVMSKDLKVNSTVVPLEYLHAFVTSVYLTGNKDIKLLIEKKI